MTRIILDTDIDTDCDDTGALAVLHALASRGEAEILGVVCSAPVSWCVPCVRAINDWYARPDLAVGSIDEAAWLSLPTAQTYHDHRRGCAERGRLYNEVIGREWVDDHGTQPAVEATKLYRQLLTAQGDSATTICAIGTLTAIAALLRSPPDDISPLHGRELVARKVRSLVTMAVAPYPSGRESFNWRMDPGSAARVIRDWPTRVVVQPVGADVRTGARLMAAVGGNHPVGRAYRVWLQDEQANRPSWDQVTVLYAVRGDESGVRARGGMSLHFDETTAAYRWGELAPGGAPRTCTEPTVGMTSLCDTVERLMIGAD